MDNADKKHTALARAQVSNITCARELAVDKGYLRQRALRQHLFFVYTSMCLALNTIP